jgi:hypothetical protein
MKIDYSMLPEHIRYGMFRWIEFGNVPGHWMTMVLQNNLVQSFGFADSTNRERMSDIVNFIYNEAPSPCWGSEDKMKQWAESGGARGQNMKLEHFEIPNSYFEPEGV